MNLNYLNKLFFMKAATFVAVVRIRTAVTATQTQKLHILPSKSGGPKICRAKNVAQGVLVFCFQKAPESRASPCHCLGKTDYNVARKGVFSASVNCISRKVWKLALKTNNNCISHRRAGQQGSIGYSLTFLSSKQTTLWLSALKQIHYTSEEAMWLCFSHVSGGYHGVVVFMSFLWKQRKHRVRVCVGNKHSINLILNVKGRGGNAWGLSVNSGMERMEGMGGGYLARN